MITFPGFGNNHLEPWVYVDYVPYLKRAELYLNFYGEMHCMGESRKKAHDAVWSSTR